MVSVDEKSGSFTTVSNDQSLGIIRNKPSTINHLLKRSLSGQIILMPDGCH